MSQRHFFIHCLILSVVTSTAIATEIYRSVDDKGRVTYSDQATRGAQQVQIAGSSNRQMQHVVRVYDGDTIVLENGKHVRLLGINTPEIESRHQVEEPGGVAAKQWLQAQLPSNSKIYLEFDQVRHDKYKRLLAYVYLPDGKHLNLALLENGLGAVSIIPPNGRYADELSRAQQHAEKKKLGIWAMPEYQSRPISQISSHTKGWQRFIGTPITLRKGKKYTRLIINDKTDIRIANANLHLFPELTGYLGKSIEARGWVSRNKDYYTILIGHPSALISQ
ncbi:MAG: thermonuclease family protein [Nitrosomonas sp.]|nr:thermonuclease family protein [Nitrosomonas sp.]